MMHLAVLLSTVWALAQGCPTIITRSQWGGRSPTCRTSLGTQLPYIIIHHTEGAACSSQSTCSTQMRNIQNYHMNSNGWCDIGYNFLIGGDGKVYEGRGWSTVGAHATNYNSNSIGICFIGSFMNGAPTTAAQNAAKSLISCATSRKTVRNDYTLKGHRNVGSTDCPGNSLYNIIKTWPRFSA